MKNETQGGQIPGDGDNELKKEECEGSGLRRGWQRRWRVILSRTLLRASTCSRRHPWD